MVSEVFENEILLDDSWIDGEGYQRCCYCMHSDWISQEVDEVYCQLKGVIKSFHSWCSSFGWD